MDRAAPANCKNILFVSTIGDLYGGERSLLEVVKQMSPAWRPRFVIPGPGRFMGALEDAGYSFDVLTLHHGTGLRAAIKKLQTIARLCGLFRRHEIDVVHLNLHYAAPLVALSCLLSRIPLVVHVRNIEERDRSMLYRHLFRRATAYVCISQAVFRKLLEKKLLSGRQAGNVWVIPDGRDTSLYEHGDGKRIRQELGIGDRTPLVGMVARIEPMKGQDIFLKMAALVASRIPEVHFLMAGDLMEGRHKSYMEDLIDLQNRLGLNGRVSIVGYREDIPDILAALDCFVHSSHHGAFVSVLIEVLAAGVPIVVSDVDGIPECVGREGAADLVSPIDPETFAGAVIRTLTDPARADRMSRLGRERAKRCFTIEQLARQTEEVFVGALRATRDADLTT
jgi:glycosyltransferase involved in cell wall biosynthesis